MVPSHFRSTSTDSTPWQRLLARKSIVLEPRSTSELTECISEYKRFITTPNSTGAILMGESSWLSVLRLFVLSHVCVLPSYACFIPGVCRGKISEGVSYAILNECE